MTDILTIDNLFKSFGKEKVIDGLTFSVPEGSVFGFIGKNGAGKTTTMKMTLGLLPSDGGKISVCGERVLFGQTATNRHIGYLPDVPEFYGYMRPKEYLKLCGEITGMDSAKIKARSEELLDLVGLAGINKKIGGFSRGMKQRLGISQALLNEPKLLICDEPTSALDPVGRKEILDILLQVKGKTTVIFSTHILSDVERICDRIAVLNKGKLALSGTVAELKEQRRNEGFTVTFDASTDKEQVLKVLAQNSLQPISVEDAEPNIENLFMEVIL
jgi:ABC-2 type transport system ATP-binding protein